MKNIEERPQLDRVQLDAEFLLHPAADLVPRFGRKRFPSRFRRSWKVHECRTESRVDLGVGDFDVARAQYGMIDAECGGQRARFGDEHVPRFAAFKNKPSIRAEQRGGTV